MLERDGVGWSRPPAFRAMAGLIVWTTLVVSCRSTSIPSGDLLYEAGQYGEAAEAFQAYLEGHPADPEATARALYRLGVIYARTDSPLHSQERSIAVLERLAAEHPQSPYAVEGLLLLDLQLRFAAARRAVVEQQNRLESLEGELAHGREEEFRLQKRMGEQEGALTASRRRISDLEAEIGRLRRDLKAREAELEQLEQLKEIDLQVPPPGPQP